MQLPIWEKRGEILETIKDHQVVILVGMPGSGKTTQLPQFLYEAGYAKPGMIGISQPRRLAAASAASRVAEELRLPLGKQVGFRVRFNNKTTSSTKICFLTDGVLLRDAMGDKLLYKYSVIIIDEAHERSLNIDLLLGLLKGILRRRPELRVLITSATVDADAFSAYFDGAPIINVAGKMYPVETIYSATKKIEFDAMPEVAALMASAIHRDRPPGDILVFLPGEYEIKEALQYLLASKLKGAEIIPVFSNLTLSQQARVFKEFPGQRKIILATNIAETSLTIGGIRYVVDTGLIKQMTYSPEAGMDTLTTVEHSQAGCNQRAGRAGRLEAGECYRLYTVQNFTRRPRFTEPEITRSNLVALVLQMAAMELEYAEEFDFLNLPDQGLLTDAYDQLATLGAITPTPRKITALGRSMADLPFQPKMARMVIEGVRFGCVANVVSAAALLSVRDPFLCPKGRTRNTTKSIAQFKHPTSDIMTLCKLRRWIKENGISLTWCWKHLLDYAALKEALQIEEQVLYMLRERGIGITETNDENVIMRAVVSGLGYGLLELSSSSGRTYHPVHRRLVKEISIHSSSVLASLKKAPRWIVAMGVLETNRPNAYTCTVVDPAWLPYLAPNRSHVGIPMLKSYTPGESEVRVCRQVIYDETPVGVDEAMIPFAAARRMQEESIRNAEREGLIPLIFQQSKEPAFKWLTAEVGDDKYRLIHHKAMLVSPGETWYCRVLPDNKSEECFYVEPVLKVLDLSPQARDPVVLVR